MKLPESKLIKRQTKVFTTTGEAYGKKADIIATVRYDDECGNGHNSFAITADIYKQGRAHTDRNYIAGGCCHEEIAKHFPELAPLIKWHFTSSDGPMHYVANTLYHAGDTDYNGLKKGEYGAHTKRVITADISDSGFIELYSTGTIYTNKQNNPNLEVSNIKEEAALSEFIGALTIPYEIEEKGCKYSISEGNPSNLDYARSSAVWPSATIEQLQDEQTLKDRLPALMAEFKQDMESLGFTY